MLITYGEKRLPRPSVHHEIVECTVMSILMFLKLMIYQGISVRILFFAAVQSRGHREGFALRKIKWFHRFKYMCSLFASSQCASGSTTCCSLTTRETRCKGPFEVYPYYHVLQLLKI